MKQLFEGEGDVCDVITLISLMRDELIINKQMVIEASELKLEEEDYHLTVTEASKQTAEFQVFSSSILFIFLL